MSQVLGTVSEVMSTVEQLLEGTFSDVCVFVQNFSATADDRRYSEGLFDSDLLGDDRLGAISTVWASM